MSPLERFDVQRIAQQLRTTGCWNPMLSNFVPWILAQSGGLLRERPLVISNVGTASVAFDSTQPLLRVPVEEVPCGRLATAITIHALADGHFHAFVGGEERPILPDGDSFFRAFLTAAARCDAPRIVDALVQELRASLADYVLENSEIASHLLRGTDIELPMPQIDALPCDAAVQAWTEHLANNRRLCLQGACFPTWRELGRSTVAAFKDAFFSSDVEQPRHMAGEREEVIVAGQGLSGVIAPVTCMPSWQESLTALLLDVASPLMFPYAIANRTSRSNDAGMNRYLHQYVSWLDGMMERSHASYGVALSAPDVVRQRRTMRAAQQAYAFYSRPSPGDTALSHCGKRLHEHLTATLSDVEKGRTSVERGMREMVDQAEHKGSAVPFLSNAAVAIDRTIAAAIGSVLPWSQVSAASSSFSNLSAITTIAPLPEGGTVDVDYAIEVERVMDWAMRTQGAKIKQAYHPILDPVSFIDSHIDAEIRQYEVMHAVNLGLQANSSIAVKFIDKRFKNTYLENAPEDFTTENYPLRELVTRRHRDALGKQMVIESEEHPMLLEWLRRRNLQDLMLAELAKYRNSIEHTQALKTLQADMILAQMLRYLADHRGPSPYIDSVERFLKGQNVPKLVKFHGAELSGVFLVPCQAGGVLVSVDDDQYFHIGVRTHQYWRGWKADSMELPVFPDDDVFKKWVLERVPLYDWLRLSADDDAFLTRDSASYSGPWRLHHGKHFTVVHSPFTFQTVKNHSALIERLFEGMMQRLASDIDTLIYTEREEYTERGLEALKSFVMLFTMALLASVGGSSLQKLAKTIAASMADMGIYTSLSALQVHIADSPPKVAAYWKQVLAAAVVSGLNGIVGTIPLTAGKLLAPLMTSRRVAAAIEIYRHARNLATQARSGWPSRVRWARLESPARIDLLTQAARDSASAVELARSVGWRALERSIRYGFSHSADDQSVLEYTWGDFDVELPRVTQRIAADLKCLNDARVHMAHLQKGTTRMVRFSMPGDPRREAARWITQGGSLIDIADFSALLRRYEWSTLTNVEIIDAIYADVYRPVPGQPFRPYRTSGQPMFASVDIARSAYELELKIIARKHYANLGDMLFAATMRLHPFGDGNANVARTLYALAQLQEGRGWFQALSVDDEYTLSGLPRAVDADFIPHVEGEVGRLGDFVDEPVQADLEEEIESVSGPSSPRFSFSEIGMLMKKVRALPTVSVYFTSTAGKSFEAANMLADFLKEEGYQAGVRKIALWDQESAPTYHYYVAFARKQEGTLIVDVTARDFDSRFRWSLIAEEDGWRQVFLGFTQNKDSVIRYRDFEIERRPRLQEQVSFSDATYDSLRDFSHEPTWYRVPALSAARRLQSIVEGNGMVRHYLTQPQACLAVAKEVVVALRAEEIPYEVLGTFIWGSSRTNWPLNHFVVKAEIDDHVLMIDPTADQFLDAHAFYGPLREWRRMFQSALPRAAIRGRFFNSVEQAEVIFSPSVPQPMHAQQGPGTLMQRPSWYADNMQACATAELQSMKETITIGERKAKLGLSSITEGDIAAVFHAQYEKAASILGIRTRQILLQAMVKPILAKGQQYHELLGRAGVLAKYEARTTLSNSEKANIYEELAALIDRDIVAHPDTRRLKQLQILKVEIAVQQARLNQY